ncbi:MAG: ATP-binding protein, partial [Myxococcaceae bacterium]
MLPDLLKTMWPIFVSDAREQLAAMGDAMVALERETGDGPKRLDEFRRLAHGLKGSAAALGLSDFEEIAHALEDLVQGEDGARLLTSAKVDAALAALSALETAIQKLSPADAFEGNAKAVVASLHEAAGHGGEIGALPPADPMEALAVIMPAFHAECVRAVEEMRRRISSWSQEQPPPSELAFFAETGHKLKGSARALGEPSVGDLAERLERAALAGELNAVRGLIEDLASAIALAAPREQPALDDDLWAVFRSEAEEAALALEARLAERVAAGEGVRAGELDKEIATLVATLKATAQALERAPLAHAIHLLEGPVNEGRHQAALACVASIRGALGAKVADEPTAPMAPAPTSHPGSAIMPLLDALEEQFIALRSPTLTDRSGPAERAYGLLDEAERLATSAGLVGLAQPAQALRELLQALVQGNASGSALVTAADQLSSMYTAAKQAPVPAEQTRRSTSVPNSDARAAATDQMTRVSSRMLEVLSQRIEAMAVGRATQERHLRELRGLGEAARGVLEELDKQASRLRLARAPGWEELLQTVGRLRAIHRALARMTLTEKAQLEQVQIATNVVRRDLRDLTQVSSRAFVEPLDRAARSLAGRLAKKVNFQILGEELKVDRTIAERLKDPLLHLVRNALDHGIDLPATRMAAGRPEAGTLQVKVERQGSRMRIEVKDDGVGLSKEKIRATALRKGILTAAELEHLAEAELMQLIFRPGFSTAAQITNVSGRGVGLDVVQETAKELQGTVQVHSEPGQGTRFTLDLPLTLATTNVVLVMTSGFQVALPSVSVERLLRVTPTALGMLGGRATIEVAKEHLPFQVLSELIGVSTEDQPQAGGHRALVLANADVRAVFRVDEILGQEEVIVHPLARQLSHAKHLAGIAVLDGARIVPVLSVPVLL